MFSSITIGQLNWLVEIPETEIKASEIFPDINIDSTTIQARFQASQLITLGEYKAFLTFLEKKYGVSKSNQYLPDSSITYSVEDYKKYLNDTIYENYPVLGVSWENAMAYSIWKAREDNLKENKQFYRLPNFTEYAAIRKYDSLNPNKKLVRDDYSEWSIIPQDETFFTFYFSFNGNFKYYFAEHNDYRSSKRKIILGNNFHFKRNNLFLNEMYSMYQIFGYHFVGFRLILTEIGSESEDYIYESIYRLYDFQ